MIHEHAVFRFNDGDFIGRVAIQAVFEKTWKGARFESRAEARG